MTIYYTDGRSLEGVLLRRTDDSLRVAVEGSDDVEEFTRINGVWVSGDCEPVRIEFAWEPQFTARHQRAQRKDDGRARNDRADDRNRLQQGRQEQGDIGKSCMRRDECNQWVDQ